MFRGLLILLFLLCSIATHQQNSMAVAANGNTPISGPFLQLEKPTPTRLTITEPHLPHFLSCIATIEENFYSQNETEYYYTWFRNGIELDGLSGKRNDYQIYQNGSLRLPPNEKASGIYRCKINANKTAVISESITVVFPVLKRLQAKTTYKAIRGSSVTLNCPVSSVPIANVSWFHGNVSLPKINTNNSLIFLNNGSLVIRRVSVDDIGKYKCVVQNAFAVRSVRQFSLTLTVEEKISSDFWPATSSTNLIPSLQNSSQFVLKGENLILRCYAISNFVNIDWWFQRSENDTYVKVLNGSVEYQINNASIENHQGFYSCTTAIDRQTFHVVVTVPPTILHPLPSYETLITASLAFTCRSAGNPPPSIDWYHNGALFESSYSRYINGNELLIHSFDPEEEGIYQCFARNVAGEVYSAAEVRFRSKNNELLRINPLRNIQCLPHSFNTINVTFESSSMESLFIVHIVEENPHRWTSPFAPMKLNHSSHVIISTHLPIYRPFELITRVLFPTSELRSGSKAQQQTLLSSLRSAPVTCCTQGLLLHFVDIGVNSTFLTWSQPNLKETKFFVVQFLIDATQPHPRMLLNRTLRGTMQHVELNAKDIERKLVNFLSLNEKEAKSILARIEKRNNHNEAFPGKTNAEDNIFSLVVPANISGILLQNFTRMKIRVLIITAENENLPQDFRYVQWKMIENDTTELVNTPYRLSIVEARMVGFNFQEDFKESCIFVCIWKIQFPIINMEQPKCEQRTILDSILEIRGLKPTEHYRFNFFNCESQFLYGQLDVKTLPDPPGTISAQRIVRHNGLKLTWKPPLHPNGKVHHYNIQWTLGNITHEANVMDCSSCSYKFPNLSETSKINASVRVVGETGVGAPIFIDLREISHHFLEKEHSPTNNVLTGIVIGAVLSLLCILCFATIIVFYKRRFEQPQIPSNPFIERYDVNFTHLNNTTGIPDTIGVNGDITIQQDAFELQTLIPKSAQINLLANRLTICQSTPCMNTNGRLPPQQQRVNCERQRDENKKVLTKKLRHSLGNENIDNGLHVSSQRLVLETSDLSRALEMPSHCDKANGQSVLNAMPEDETKVQQRSLYMNLLNLQVDTPPMMITPNAAEIVLLTNNKNGDPSRNTNNKKFIPCYSNHSKQINDIVCLLYDEDSIQDEPRNEAAMELNNKLKASEMGKTATKTARKEDPSITSKNFYHNNNNTPSMIDPSSIVQKTKAAKISDKIQQKQQQNDSVPSQSLVKSLKSSELTSAESPCWQMNTSNRPTANQAKRPNLDPNG